MWAGDREMFVLVDDRMRERALKAVRNLPAGWIVKVRPPTRSLEQNAFMWGLLSCFAEQLQWPVNGALTWLTSEEWKDILTAGFNNETVRIAQGLDGGVVMIGGRTSRMTMKVFSEFLEYIQAVAAERGVDISRCFREEGWTPV